MYCLRNLLKLESRRNCLAIKLESVIAKNRWNALFLCWWEIRLTALLLLLWLYYNDDSLILFELIRFELLSM